MKALEDEYEDNLVKQADEIRQEERERCAIEWAKDVVYRIDENGGDCFSCLANGAGCAGYDKGFVDEETCIERIKQAILARLNEEDPDA